MFEIEDENYEQLRIALREVFESIHELSEFEIDNRQYRIKKILSGDMKFLSIVYGLKSARSNHPCIWCVCPKEKFSEFKEKWSIQDESLGARKLKEANKYEQKQQFEMGYQYEPLTSIDFDSCVVDLLHLFLRISGALIELFFSDLFKADSNDSTNIELRPNLKNFVIFLKDRCDIQNPLYISSKTQLAIRSFNGNELKRIFKNIDFETRFPQIDRINKISLLWKDYFNLYNNFKTVIQNLEELEKKLFKWHSLFLKCYFPHHITPYMHAFVFHLPEFVKLHKNISLFSLQGLEKFNDVSTSIYHRCTNKKNDEKKYLKQMIEKQNRTELYSTYDFSNHF